MPVQTAKVSGRRKLHYASFEDLLADADRLSKGPVKMLGNWSPGQVYKHLATVYNGSIDGFDVKFPAVFRAMAGMFKKKMISNAMPAGMKLPSKLAEKVQPSPVSNEEGLAALISAVQRLLTEPSRAEHPVFGKLEVDEWNQIHLRHAELHMSFLVPE